MSDPRAQLAELIADVRAVVEANASQGISDESLLAPVIEDAVDAASASPAEDAAAGHQPVVSSVGDPEADLMILSSASGGSEDASGEAGQMLDRMLQNVLGLSRSQVNLTTVAIGSRPSPAEVEAYVSAVQDVIRTVAPKLILVLGSVALRSLAAPSSEPPARGVWQEADGVPVMPTFHPDFLQRRPENKRLTFEDLKAVRARYDELGGKR